MKALFFSPYSNIWDHSFPESLIAEGLSKQGVEVLTVRCDGMLSAHCVAMSASGIGYGEPAATRQQVCRACTKRRDLIDTTMSFGTLVMDAMVDGADRASAAAACANVDSENWADFLFDDVPLGRYAAYEFLLDHKLVGTKIPAELWSRFLDQLRNTILVYLVARKILAEHAPTHLIVFNRLYSANHAFVAAADKVGIPSYTLQGGGHITRRAETMTMFNGSESLSDVFRTPAWKAYQRSPIGAAEIELVGEHFSGLLEGSSAFAYSSAFEASQPSALRSRLGVPPDAQVLLLPLSSEDEINAARLADALPAASDRVSLFAGQFEWIQFVLDYARTQPELHFIVRLHPRMYPNKRDSVQSPVVDELMTILENRPPNVSLNLPSDGVSLYDLMQIVDVLLSYRSSVGAEFSAFGIPVVVPANADFYTYPAEINRIGSTRAEYTEHIANALESGWSIDNVRRAFRWYSFLFSRIAIDFSDSVHARPSAMRPQKPGLKLWVWRKLVYVFIQFGPLIRERIALKNRRFPLSSERLFLDVLENERGSLAESPLWPTVNSSAKVESALLNDYLAQLTSTLWKDIAEPNSLVGRIRRNLKLAR